MAAATAFGVNWVTMSDPKLVEEFVKGPADKFPKVFFLFIHWLMSRRLSSTNLSKSSLEKDCWRWVDQCGSTTEVLCCLPFIQSCLWKTLGIMNKGFKKELLQGLSRTIIDYTRATAERWLNQKTDIDVDIDMANLTLVHLLSLLWELTLSSEDYFLSCLWQTLGCRRSRTQLCP